MENRNVDLLFQHIEDSQRYKKCLLFYVVTFYFIASIILLMFQTIFISITNVDNLLFSEILVSGDYLKYLEEPTLGTAIRVIQYTSTANFLIYVILIIGCIVLFKKDFIRDFKSMYIDGKLDIKNIAINLGISTCAFFTLLFSSNMLIGLLKNALDLGNADNQILIELSLKYCALPIFLSAGILAPIVEELIFRKAIFGLFTNKKIGLIISTLTFGVIHIVSSITQGYNFLELIVLTLPYIVAGLIFGFLYMKNNYNIYYVIVIHMISNILSMSVILLS